MGYTGAVAAKSPPKSWFTKKRVLIGAGIATALYLLTRKSSPSFQGTAVLPPPSAVLKPIVARPVPAQTGVTYYGRGSVGWPISMLVTTSAVVNKLHAMGFTDVAAYTDSSSLPASWPADQRDGNVFASGTYTGAPKDVTLPSQVQAVWTYS